MDAAFVTARTGRVLSITKYEVVEEIGHGGMATVYRAHDRRLGRDVALKVIHPHLRDSPEVKHRFFVEAQAVAKLRHPNIVEVYDVSAEGEKEQYLVVELLRGRTLRTMLKAHGALPPEVAAAIAMDLLGALAHAHGSGVIHRDVKPENVMIEQRDNGGSPSVSSERQPSHDDVPPSSSSGRVVVKLTDFGIAKLLDAQGVTSTGQVLGSPAHMAPEQIEGGDVDERADVFALGVLLYEAMVGHLPFEGNNPAQVLRRVLDGVYPRADRERPTVGRAWSDILDRALARKPEERFPNANAMREAVGAELRRLGITPPRHALEGFMQDPPAFVPRHEAAMIEALCARAGEARKAGDALAAAADYNRALAYAPEDAALLRVVATMHRAEQRGRLYARLGRVAAVAVAFGGLAFLVSRAFAPTPTVWSTAPRKDARTHDPIPAPSESVPAMTGSATPTTSASPSRASIAPHPTTTAAHPVERAVTVVSTRPHFGVLVAIDDAPPREVNVPDAFTLDGRAHDLRFRCVNDVCEPQTRHIAEGTHEEQVSVALRVRPAELVVVGDPTLTYQVVEEPSVYVRAGTPAPVPMRQYKASVHIVELPSNRTREVALTAGQAARVSFDGTP